MSTLSVFALIAKSLGVTDRCAVPLPAWAHETRTFHLPPGAVAGIFAVHFTAPRSAFLAASLTVFGA
jgi:hypothetical protein